MIVPILYLIIALLILFYGQEEPWMKLAMLLFFGFLTVMLQLEEVLMKLENEAEADDENQATNPRPSG